MYISSTFEDLRECREKLSAALRMAKHDVVGMEEYLAVDQRPVEKALMEVESSDVYVGIFARRYGYVPPDGDQSITELEYRHAVELGKPIFAFLLDDDAAWPPALMDTGFQLERISALREELLRQHVVSRFTTCDELALEALAALNRWAPDESSASITADSRSEYDVLLLFADSDGRSIAVLERRLRQETELSGFLWGLGEEPGSQIVAEMDGPERKSRSAAIFLGPGGFGPQQDDLLPLLMDRAANDAEFRVIPVLLPGSSEEALPLHTLTWVDFRDGLDDSAAFDRLVAGIRGVPPIRAARPTKDTKADVETKEAAETMIEITEPPERLARISRKNPDQSTKVLDQDEERDLGPGGAVDESEPTQNDQVFTIPDAPAVIDLLGRRPLAQSLAARLRRMRRTDPQASFLLHIDGPWGSGKSTLLNFLSEELQSDSLIVYFNAWREQAVGPPWWALLGSLRRSAFAELGWRLRLREAIARLMAVGRGYLVALLATTAATVALFVWAGSGEFDVSSFGVAAKSVAAVATLIATLWTASLLLNRQLLPGSLRRANAFMQSHSDPMEGVAEHFDTVVALIRKPVVFFVDDLDRCNETYVVDLLEAVQTLIREDPKRADTGRSVRNLPPGDKAVSSAPYFIVAADGRWIRTSYEKAYSAFKDTVTYPGRPLGYLFLEKAFQLTATLPTISTNDRQDYLDYLLGLSKADNAMVLTDQAIDHAEEQLKGASTPQEIQQRIRVATQDDPTVRRTYLAAAIRYQARDETVEATEHALQSYADLIDPNPRAMKRFVNAYGMERAVRTLEDRHPSVDKLARWTIVMLRWPVLADILRANPEAVDWIGRAVSEDVPTGTSDLFDDPEVYRTVRGRGARHGEPLDEKGIRECAGLSPRWDPSLDQPAPDH